jgi:hypothetical protein
LLYELLSFDKEDFILLMRDLFLGDANLLSTLLFELVFLGTKSLYFRPKNLDFFALFLFYILWLLHMSYHK